MLKKTNLSMLFLTISFVALCSIWISQIIGVIVFIPFLIFIIIDLLNRMKYSSYLLLGLNNIIISIFGFLYFIMFMIHLFNFIDIFGFNSEIENYIVIIVFAVIGFLRTVLLKLIKKDVLYRYLRLYVILISSLLGIADSISHGSLGFIAIFYSGIIGLYLLPDLLINEYKKAND